MTTTQTKDLAGRSCRVVIPVSTCPSRSVAQDDSEYCVLTAELQASASPADVDAAVYVAHFDPHSAAAQRTAEALTYISALHLEREVRPNAAAHGTGSDLGIRRVGQSQFNGSIYRLELDIAAVVQGSVICFDSAIDGGQIGPPSQVVNPQLAVHQVGTHLAADFLHAERTVHQVDAI